MVLSIVVDPVAVWYAEKASVVNSSVHNFLVQVSTFYLPEARRTKVVPVSMIPAVSDRMVMLP